LTALKFETSLGFGREVGVEDIEKDG